MPSPRATLSVDLAALAANYRLLANLHAKRSIAAVVKADAYGLGVARVAPALAAEGCRKFFVATLAEGIELRALLPEAWIGVFDGLLAGEEKEFAAHRLAPSLNDLGQVERFASQGSGFGIQDSGIIHVDTGITRLGLSAADVEKLPRILNPESRILLMSHLACAGEPAHPKNAEQLARFRAALALFPGAQASLANSAGLFLSPDYHFDLGRPGCALYGVHSSPTDRGIRHVATLSAPLLQIRELAADETVGYGATFAAKKGSRIGIAALGYADGYPRNLGGVGTAFVAGERVPVVGRVSMDMLALDLSALPAGRLAADTRAEFINAGQTVSEVARQAGTIGYEILTRLSRRVARLYP